MTVTSELQTLIDAVWPAMSKAVTEGLKAKAGATPKLDSVLALVEREAALARHVTLSWGSPTSADGLTARPLEVDAGSVVELRAERVVLRSVFENGLSQQEASNLSSWASSVRQGERRHALGAIAAEASQASALDAEELATLGPGWRVVAIGAVPNLEDRCTALDIDHVSCGAGDLTGVKALAYCVGALSFARLEDFALTFDPVSDGVRLALTSHVALYGFNAGADVRKYTTVSLPPVKSAAG